MNMRANRIGTGRRTQVSAASASLTRDRLSQGCKAMSPDTMDERMRSAGIEPSDLVESFARASGPGGQNVNKVSTAVTLLHRPSGISVTVQDARSQSMNRRMARKRLINAIEKKQNTERAAKRALQERERRRKSPRPAKLKARILESKRKRSELKRRRSRIAE